MDKRYTFSAPGRTEIGGNHTDHQNGCVLAAAVDLKTRAEVRFNESGMIRVFSEGYEPVQVAIDDLAAREEEKNTTAALVRGVAAAFKERGAVLAGFDAAVSSQVAPGSGLSSSAAFEVLMGRIMNGLFLDGKLSPIEIAQIGKHAENAYFGKPCGLMDQMASSVGGMVFMDFARPEEPYIERLNFDFSSCGYRLCIIDCGADHAQLTDAYAAIPRELGDICALFGEKVLRQVDEEDFYEKLPALRKRAGDRAVLRAMHVFSENRRVLRQREALKQGDFEGFLKEVEQSGLSSWLYLQNVVPGGSAFHQEMAFALALCRKLLGGRGACRVHGGGFAGTVQAFVPWDMLDFFRAGIEAVLGETSCRLLSIE